jgi:hypothetical protein
LRELGVPMAEDSFVEFYMESNWAKPMLAEALQQFEVSLSVLSVRNFISCDRNACQLHCLWSS